jgi:hypothetical protein
MPLPNVIMPLSARMRRYQWGALIAALGAALILALAWQSVDPPAAGLRATRAATDSECYPGHPSDSEPIYLRAGIESTRVPHRANGAGDVTVTAIATGAAYDCGRAGRTKQAPTITVTLEFRLKGEGLCHPEMVDSDETCSRDGKEFAVTDTYSCKQEQVCEVSSANQTFSANVDGRISTLETRSIVTNGSNVIQATSSHLLVVSG